MRTKIAMGVTVARVSVRSMKRAGAHAHPKPAPFASHANLPPIPFECLDMVVASMSSSTCSSRATIIGFTRCSTRTAPTTGSVAAAQKPPANESSRLAHALDLDTAACQGKTDGRPRLIELYAHTKQQGVTTQRHLGHTLGCRLDEFKRMLAQIAATSWHTEP